MSCAEYQNYQNIGWGALLTFNNARISRGEPPFSWEEYKQHLMSTKAHNSDSWVHGIEALRPYDHKRVSVALDHTKSDWIGRKRSEMMAAQAAAAEKENDDGLGNVDMSMNVDSPPAAPEHIPSAKKVVGTPAPRSVAKSSASVKSLRPLDNHSNNYFGGGGTNLERNFETAADSSVVSSLAGLSVHPLDDIESIVEQKKGLKDLDKMVRDADLNDYTILSMATDTDIYQETISEMNDKKVSRLITQHAVKTENIKALDNDLDLEEVKHDNSINSTELHLQDTKLQIQSYQNELDSIAAKKDRAIEAMEARHKKERDNIEDAAKLQKQNVEGDLEKAVSRKEKLEEVVDSKKKIKREYVGLTRQLSHLIKSAQNVFNLWQVGSNRGNDWSEAEPASDQHILDQKAYAEMRKEFD